MSKWYRNSVTLENGETFNIGDSIQITKRYDEDSDLFPSFNVRTPKVCWDDRMNRIIGRDYEITNISLIKGFKVNDDGWEWWVPFAICKKSNSKPDVEQCLIEKLGITPFTRLFVKKYGVGIVLVNDSVIFECGTNKHLSEVISMVYMIGKQTAKPESIDFDADLILKPFSLTTKNTIITLQTLSK